MEKELRTRVCHKHDTEANWKKATGFVPKIGEMIVYDIDENFNYQRIKIGDGVKNINELTFVNEKIYKQNEAPADAEEGALWLDLDEEAAVSGGGAAGNEVFIGTEPPTDANVSLWIDTDEEPEASGGAQVDWNAKEGEPGHILNRTHWVESEHKVLLDTTVTTSQSMAALQQKIELQEGQTCIVTFGGQQYSCTCRYLAYMGFLSLAIGNTYPIDGNNTGEPFMVMYAPLMNVTYVVIMLPDGEHSIKIEGEVKSYHTIPSAFLPKPCWMIEFDLDNPSTDVTRIELDKAIDNGEMIALRGRRYVNATVIMYYFEYRSQSGECAFCDGYGRNRITLTPNASGGYDMTEGIT